MGNVNILIVNRVVLLLLILIGVRFSSAHFSYAAGLFILFFLYDIYQSHRHNENIFPALSAANRQVCIGTIVFYGILLGDSLLLGDRNSAAESVDMAMLSLPLFMFTFLGGKYDIRRGIRYGIIAVSIIVTMYGIYRGWLGLDKRYSSFFAHPNHFGTAIAMMVPFLSSYWWKAKESWKRWGLCVLIMAMLFCLYKTGSRGAIAAFIGGCIIGIGSLLWIRRGKISAAVKKKAGIVLLLICLLGGAAFGYLQANRSGMAKLGGERIMMLEASYEIWQDHTWLGVGVSRWAEYYYSPEYHPAEGREMGLNMPHNMPVYFFTTAGIPGGIGYLAFLAVTWWGLWRTARRAEESWLSAAVLAAFWAFTLQGLVDTTIINKIPARIYFALIGFYLAAEAHSSIK